MREIIQVNGRGGYEAVITWLDGDNQALSWDGRSIYLEIASLNMRRLLTSETGYPTRLLLRLSRPEVAQLSSSPTALLLIDETHEVPRVIGSSLIARTGNTVEPIA